MVSSFSHLNFILKLPPSLLQPERSLCLREGSSFCKPCLPCGKGTNDACWQGLVPQTQYWAVSAPHWPAQRQAAFPCSTNMS